MLGQSKKLQPILSGPCIVTQAISSVLYRIANCKRSIVGQEKMSSDVEPGDGSGNRGRCFGGTPCEPSRR